MDNDFEKSPELSRAKELVKDNLEQNLDSFNKEDIAENTEEARKIIHNELGLEGKELEEATAEALAYVAEETIKDSRSTAGVSTEKDVLEATQAVLLEEDEQGDILDDNMVEKMVNDGYGAEVENARRNMNQGGGTDEKGAERDEYAKLVPELHVADSEDAKLNQLIEAVYKNVETGDADEATKSELLEAIKRFVSETRAEKVFGERKANFMPNTHVHNWIVSMNQDLAKAEGAGATDELIGRRIAALKWLEDAFSQMELAALEDEKKLGKQPELGDDLAELKLAA
ncbi:MAG: hypothetical protein LBQ02_01205 [Candidatus Nomurabacteria bacterium]|jgi:hypothetical protein|nr:hypothetical protein [Candidatus Nomurabacteria bacterium]